MNFFEDIGSGLGSLSLHDQKKWVEAELDDPMEIDMSDTESNFHRQNNQWNQQYSDDNENSNGPTVEVIEDDENERCDVNLTTNKDQDEDEDHDDSFLGILSPTALGARFALQPQKLLMAPPLTEPPNQPSQRKLSIDFEFDTSEMQNSQLIKRKLFPQKNTSSFAAANQDIFQSGSFREPQRMGSQALSLSSMFDSHMNQAPSFQNTHNNLYSSGMFTNSIFNSSRFGVNAQPQPQTVIHHHHYYSDPQLSQCSQKDVSITPRNQWSTDAISTDLQGLSFESDKQISRLNLDREKITNSNGLLVGPKVYENQNLSLQMSLGHHGPYLPSPWDSRAVPAERLPYVLLSYLQLLTNTLLSAYALHILVAMVQAIRNDVSLKMALEANSLLVEIALCQRAYRDNNCDPSERVPALEKMCDYWEKCMLQDPDSIGNRSLIGAHTLGLILNSLIEPLGLKVLSVFAFFIVVIFACNFAFGYFRARAYYGMAQKLQEKI